jgi:hypothetical protein
MCFCARFCFKLRPDVRFIVIEGDDCRPALTTLISSVWHTRARRATSELDEVGGMIGRAGQFAKRDGGLWIRR